MLTPHEFRSRNFTLPWRRVFARATCHHICWLGSLLLLACNYSATPPQGVALRRLHVVPAPSDGGMLLTWIPMSGHNAYTVKWRADGGNWTERRLGNRGNAFVPDLELDVQHSFIVTAHDGSNAMTADTIVATPRHRPDCSYPEYLELLSFFCSRAAADAFMQARGVSAADLRCRNEPVTDWGPDAPDCLYTAGEHFRMLLLRGADRVFNPSTRPPSVSETRNMLRTAIWPGRNVFDSPASQAVEEIPSANIGAVTNFKSAQSFVFKGVGAFKSRVTRFIPHDAVTGRYAVFHEGHGATGTELGADMIEYLLSRGWEVYAMSMPLEGENHVDQSAGMSTHLDLWKDEGARTSVLSIFMLPVKQLVDFIEATRPSTSALLMMGRSGGGMTAYVYGALDPRITAVISVAGGRPMSQRLDAVWGPLEIGDTEQFAPEVFAGLRHEDVMIAAGTRGGMFLFNTQDPCCFRVSHGDPFIDYLERGGTRTGRTVATFVDPDNLTHGMGPAGFSEVGRFLEKVIR